MDTIWKSKGCLAQKGWESFVSFDMMGSEYTQKQDNNLSFTFNEQDISVINSGIINGKSKSFEFSLGINRLPTKIKSLE